MVEDAATMIKIRIQQNFAPNAPRRLHSLSELFECLVEEEHEVLQEAAELSVS